MAEDLLTPPMGLRRRESISQPPSFARSPHLTKELQCSICLDVLTNPVTTPCGHSFCQACLRECWAPSQVYQCPCCKKTFNSKPDLKNNIVLTNVVLLSDKMDCLSTSGPLSEELLCPICLDVLNNPVTTLCGHNFCKTCLEKCWEKRQACICPYCKETFNECPDLKCNTTLCEIVQLFEDNTGYKREPIMAEYSHASETEDEEEILCKPSVMTEFLICLEPSPDHVTTLCGHSFCKACLKEFWEISQDDKCPCCKENVTNGADLFDQSEILSPFHETKLESDEKVLNIEEAMMTDLEEPIRRQNKTLELFVGDDHKSEGHHMSRNAVPVEEENEQKKVKMQLVQQMIHETMKKQTQIKNFKMKMSQKNKEKDEADDTEFCTDLNYPTERWPTTVPKQREMTGMKRIFPASLSWINRMCLSQNCIFEKMFHHN